MVYVSKLNGHFRPEPTIRKVEVVAKKKQKLNYDEFIVSAADLLEEERKNTTKIYLEVEPDELPCLLRALKKHDQERWCE